MLGRCQWCTSIGNAILTSADLDYWQDDWDGLHSSSGSEGEELSDSEQPVSETGDDNGNSNSPGKPGFITAKALDCTAMLSITIELLKWDDSPAFNLVDVTVEVSAASDDCLLHAMAGEEPVRVRYEVISAGILPQLQNTHTSLIF